MAICYSLGNWFVHSARWTITTNTNCGVHIMGSGTYCDMAAYWRFSTEVFAAPMNEIPKGIFSRARLSNSVNQA